METYKYLEIVRRDNEEVVERIDVSALNNSSIIMVEMRRFVNLDHDEYYAQNKLSKIKLILF